MKYYLWKYTDFMNNDREAVMVRTGDGQVLGIPADQSNTDYQAYLAWVAEGNTPEEWTAE